MRPDFRDPRLLLLVMALTLTLLALVAPLAPIKRRSFDSLGVVDITGSMNTPDPIMLPTTSALHIQKPSDRAGRLPRPAPPSTSSAIARPHR